MEKAAKAKKFLPRRTTVLAGFMMAGVLAACAGQNTKEVRSNDPPLTEIQLTRISEIDKPAGIGPSDIPSPQAQTYPLGPGDILQVSIFAGGEKQEEFAVEVSPRGTIAAPLIGPLEVSGRSTFDIAEQMTRILERDFFVNPQVLVGMKESGRKIYVMGEVQRPGAYGVQEGLTVLNACILAGGFTPYASPARTRVTRVEDGKQKIIIINLSDVQEGKEKDLILQAGDRIDVSSRLF